MPVLKECEVCGREAHSLFRRKIEGVLMEVCNDCKDVGEEPNYERSSRKPTRNASKFRDIYSSKKSKPTQKAYKPPSRPSTYKKRENISNLKIVDNYIKLLVQCRNKEGLSAKEFANSLFIKENYYHRIEKGTTQLNIKLARRIEKKYKITLVETEDFQEEEEDNKMQYAPKSQDSSDSMVYFRKRGKKPEYDQ
ncbi:helix-turn-helix domain-containing protein [Promethearchaeum syntrophicum]|uniref:Helix-turn-helix domain-containing protein n=1 Tax=Promethearchaeum syntrophicum TaxID=2594042 RepID=A0A5B9D6L1_9ARCH|nr:helix-turn-helix domain-containing protein [Candidatus Prometheoarchaeum syntrophicum]QEE14759.1 transcription factor [Candidatus Prometheoarchaeum syntrophicum]